jgi:hypothetical protein
VRCAAKEAAGAAVDALLCWLGRASWSIDRFSEEHETAFDLIAVALHDADVDLVNTLKVQLRILMNEYQREYGSNRPY